MSEKILKALLQLFAIIAKVDADGPGRRSGRTCVERFLQQQSLQGSVAQQLARFDAFVLAYQGGGEGARARKRTSVNSVKVLKICTQVNEELAQRQKFVVLLHLLELIQASGDVSEQELEFVCTVAETFNIAKDEFEQCLAFGQQRTGQRTDSAQLLYIEDAERKELSHAHHLRMGGLQGEMQVLHVPSVGMYLLRYIGEGNIYLNGTALNREQHYVLSNGSSLRPPGGRPLYYSDIIGCFLNSQEKEPIVFKAEGIAFDFRSGRRGLHKLQLAESSGRLVGIMGGSGSGKSTLLSVLNGSLKPTEGKVTINGVDVHAEGNRIRGVIGHVSQDDLLIEELTVYENLFYNAKLCFGDLDDAAIGERVGRLLQALGLYETKDLKVGSPLEKTISGGQRKRLNIALELIREPSVLFVDEPTSGLSSRDSENIMELLKELAMKGRVVFVVIHQPSSDIFKLFDRLLLIDQEGYPVYYGDPVDAVVYFKRAAGQVNADMGQCGSCGNVNPEQIFNILEARLVDEYGNETDQRRIGPDAWNEVYQAQAEVRMGQLPEVVHVPSSTFRAPGLWAQFKVFLARDLFSKVANRQYVLINLLEAPVLAGIMAFFVRYERQGQYVFNSNENIPQFLFISVIVALFLGLTVSAEEIIRDRRILQRERFLALSKGSYLSSKVAILFGISAIQSLLYVLVASVVLGIQGMTLSHWAVLFSVSCFANVLGLNVSASFNSAKVIYILIPVLIIPQLLFSGVIVKFDKLHPWFGSERSVPLIGNVMASRWGYEAMAVTQFKDNAYERNFYPFDQRMRMANWKKDLWVRELENRLSEVRRDLKHPADPVAFANDLRVLRNELRKETRTLKGFTVPGLERLKPGKVDAQALAAVDQALDVLVKHYRRAYKMAEQEKEARITQMTATEQGKVEYFALLDGFRNESLADFVTNKNDVNVIVESEGELVQKSDPIYKEPWGKGLLGAQFYAPNKHVLGRPIPTLWANMLVLWAMSISLLIALRLDWMPWAIQRLSAKARD
jgi:ABC transport system ATP-binding/permease protein